MISYQDLEKLSVPKETREFIDELLCNINFFVEEEQGVLNFRKYSTFAILYTMYHSEKWINLLGNISKKFLYFKTSSDAYISDNLKIELFSKYLYLFDCPKMGSYCYLHPLDILFASLKDISTYYDDFMEDYGFTIDYLDLRKFIKEKLYPQELAKMNEELLEKIKGTIDESLLYYLQIASKINLGWKDDERYRGELLPVLFAIYVNTEVESLTDDEQIIYLLLKCNALEYQKVAEPLSFWPLYEYDKEKPADYFYINSLLEDPFSSCKSITDVWKKMIKEDEKVKEYLKMIDLDAYNKFRKCLFDEDYATSVVCEKVWNQFQNHILPIGIEGIKDILKIHIQLQSLMEKSNLLKELLKEDKDIEKLSLFLGWYLTNDDNNEEQYQESLEKYGFSRLDIISALGLNLDFSVDEKNFPQLFVENYKKYLMDPVDKNKLSVDKLSVDFKLMNILFGTKLNDSNVLENLAKRMKVDLVKLKVELETGRDFEESLTSEERLALLEQQEIEILDSTKVDSILNFGTKLFSYANYIHTEIPKIISSDTKEKSITSINQALKNIYQRNNKKPFFFSKWFLRKSYVKVDIKKVDPCMLSELRESIDENIQTLSQELIGYSHIQDYIAVYYQKNLSYLKIVNLELSKLEEQTSLTISDEDYANLLQTRTKLQLLKDKKNHFEVSNQLMRQQLLKVNQMMVNHSITLNALEMARDDLLPLMGIELSIGKGLSTENDSTELTSDLMDLFQTLLNQNQEGITENIKRLKKSGVSDEIYALIDKDVQSFLQKLTETSSDNLSNPQIELPNDGKVKILDK